MRGSYKSLKGTLYYTLLYYEEIFKSAGAQEVKGA